MFPSANYFLERYEAWGYPQKELTLPTVIRVNRLKISSGKPFFDKKVKLVAVPQIPDAYFFQADFSPASTPAYLLGHIYIQEAASQLAAFALDPQPTDTILDMCSAPGSKTTQIASMLNNKGNIVALDLQTGRLQKLTNNLERCGVTNAIVVRKDAQYVSDLNVSFDKILLDAPCSGNFVIDDEWFEKRNINGVQTNARLQRILLLAAIDVLKPGGVIVYSTCSLEKEENEEVVESVLNEGVEIVDTGLSWGEPGLTPATKLCKRYWPSLTNTQGFFIAKLKKKN